MDQLSSGVREILKRRRDDILSGGAESTLQSTPSKQFKLSQPQQQQPQPILRPMTTTAAATSAIPFPRFQSPSAQFFYRFNANSSFSSSSQQQTQPSTSTQQQPQCSTTTPKSYASLLNDNDDDDSDIHLNILQDLPKEMEQLVPTQQTTTAAPPKKQLRSKWGEMEGSSLLTEITIEKPFQFKKGSGQRGDAWRNIEEHFNNKNKHFITQTAKGLQDKYRNIKEKFQKKMRDEERASGIAPEYTDLDRLIGELIDLEKASNEIVNKETDEAAKKKIESQAKGQEIRKRSTEGLVGKRHNGKEANMTFLKEKMEREMKLREDSLQLSQANMDRQDMRMGSIMENITNMQSLMCSQMVFFQEQSQKQLELCQSMFLECQKQNSETLK